MSKSLFLPLALALAAFALTGCPGETPKCGEGEGQTRCAVDSGEEGETDAGTDAGVLPCDGACTGNTPVCNAATNTCVRCNATAGCGSTQVCDTSVAGGQCVECVDDTKCNGAVCDLTTKSCVTCTATAGCSGDDVCDTSVTGGQCVTCTATAGCGDDLVCDTTVSGGACVECVGTADCGAGVCDQNVCITCNAAEGCDATEICDTTVAGGQCVTCTATAGCTQPEFCDTNVAGGQCVSCTATTGCASDETCDTSVAGGECYRCKSGLDCAGSPEGALCDTTVAGGRCVACLSDAECVDPSIPLCDSTLGACRAVTPADTSAQIAAVRAAPTGTSHMLPIYGAVVTYLKPATGTEPATFFLQAEQSGPAIAVQVDPASTLPPLSLGDRVNFQVNAVTTIAGGLKTVEAISDVTVIASGVNVSALVQDLSAATDVASALDSYESEVVAISGTLVGGSLASGSGHAAFAIDTVGMTGDSNLRLRLASTLISTYELGAGCTFTLDYGPMWRFNAAAQPSAYRRSDFSSLECAAPTVVSAAASSPTQVLVTFSRAIDDSTVLADGSQFTFNNGLTAVAAVHSATNAKQVLVTTSVQTGRTSYDVTVEATVEDLLGTAVGMPNSATFPGFVTPATLLLNEINPNIGSSRDLIELLVLTPGSTNGITVTQESASVTVLATLPDIDAAAGDIIVVHLAPNATTDGPSETTAKDQSPNATFSSFYDTAWDVRGGTTGITFSGQVIRVIGPDGATQDAVPFSNFGSVPGGFTTRLQAIQSEGHWLPMDCGGDPCSATSTPTQNEVSADWRGAGTAPTTNSISRKITGDSNSNADWNLAGPSSWGLGNPPAP